MQLPMTVPGALSDFYCGLLRTITDSLELVGAGSPATAVGGSSWQVGIPWQLPRTAPRDTRRWIVDLVLDTLERNGLLTDGLALESGYLTRLGYGAYHPEHTDDWRPDISHRHVSAVLFLNTLSAEQAGELTLLDPDRGWRAFAPTTGGLVAWPSTWRHATRPVNEGRPDDGVSRYSIPLWLTYDPRRALAV